MATLFLIRHGLTAQTGRILYGRTGGVPLDERGRAQAEDLVRRFDGIRLTAVYSSPLERCVATVEPLANARRLPIVVREDLVEMEAGSWTGRSLPQLRRQKRWSALLAEPSAFTFPGGGEAFVDAMTRAVAEVRRIARRHRRGRVAIATHGDIVRILMTHFAGAPLDEFHRIVVDPASVSVVQLDGAQPRLLLLNDTGGLARFRERQTTPWEASDAVAEGDGGRKLRG
jgi:probable phosphomutase (TIGR03848 family)